MPFPRLLGASRESARTGSALMKPDLESFRRVAAQSTNSCAAYRGSLYKSPRFVALARRGTWVNAGAIPRSHLEVELNPNLLRRREFITASGMRRGGFMDLATATTTSASARRFPENKRGRRIERCRSGGVDRSRNFWIGKFQAIWCKKERPPRLLRHTRGIREM